MAMRLAEAAMDFSHRRRRWILAAVAGYAVYRAYHLPSVARRRRKFIALVRNLVALVNAVGSSAETLALVSSEINLFLRSDSGDLPLPPSLVQLSKIVCSDEVSTSVSRISEAVTIGMVRGFSKASPGSADGPNFRIGWWISSSPTPERGSLRWSSGALRGILCWVSIQVIQVIR
ncbi:hypothetical protein IHE45_13G004900 [Dioscorea alata]|uniref:Uncharacterized protein n=1 Tax=Dioscorea alata TaxID=55571 RepID=A0ACB7UW83_DIOAL|nr:hypothetical protein IHE45_13G004900 [Dioscorea alata]